MSFQRSKTRVSLLLLLASLTLAAAAGARERSPSSPLAPLWTRLETARGYRTDFVVPGQGTRAKTYKQLLDCYVSVTCISALAGKSPRQEFEDLYAEFQAANGDEATWGIQESLSEILAGQALIGNDNLVRALRARFPGVNQGASDPLVLLEQSENDFKAGIDLAVERLRTNAASLRPGGAAGAPNPTFPFWVENTRIQGGPVGELVENEMHRFTEVVYRQSLAGVTRAKRKFFFENEKPAGRAEAIQLAKRAAQNTYLHTIVLTKAQPSATFQQNNGHELKRQVQDAQRLFEDILSGFNPIELRSDFLPAGEIGAEGFVCNAESLVSQAVTSEGNVEIANRDVDQNQTTLANELASQQSQFINEIAALTGISVQQIAPTRLINPTERQELLAEADVNMENGIGSLGQAFLEVQRAASAARLVKLQIDQIPQKIRAIEYAEGEINKIKIGLALERGAAEAAASLATSISVSCCSAWTPSVSFVPGIFRANNIRSAFGYHQAIQEAVISNLSSSQRVQELLFEQATLWLSLEGAGIEVESRKAILDQERTRLDRLIRGYVTAQSNLAAAYFNNPGYRLQRDTAEEIAENDYEDAMVAAYEAAKALEYEWAERFQNPVERTDGGIPEALGASYVPFVRAESAFAVRSAGAGVGPSAIEPSLSTFMSALRQWDLKLRQTNFRNPEPLTDSVVWSLRRNILGFNSGDSALDELRFSEFVKAHRRAGGNPVKDDLRFEFAIQLGTNALLPGRRVSPQSPSFPNIKLTDVQLNLRPRVFRNLIESGGGQNPPVFTVDLRDSSVVRTFFSSFPDDDLLVVDLPGAREFELSPNNSPIRARVDGIPVVLPASPPVRFKGLSPAVSKWVMQLDMTQLGNSDLILENLADIEIRVNYQFGRPPALGGCP